MRKQRLVWEYLVIAVLLIAYGGFIAFRNSENQALTISAIIAFIIGILMLVVYLVFYFISKNKKKQASDKTESESEQVKPNVELLKEEATSPQENKNIAQHVEEKASEPKQQPKISRDYSYTPRQSRSYDESSGYAKQVGYGPIIEINGNRIRDMRTNTYYQIDGNQVYVNGGSLVYIIERNRIKTIGGNLLYEMYGSNINKVFGGYYASVSGNYITKFDLSQKFEITSQFSNRIILLVAVLVFGER